MIVEAATTYLTTRPDVKKVYLFDQNYAHGHQVSKGSRAYLSRKRPDVQSVGDDFIPIAQTAASGRMWCGTATSVRNRRPAR